MCECVCVCEVAACEPPGSILGSLKRGFGTGRGQRGSVLRGLIKEDVFVSLDTFYI